ncbi:Shikimate kinase 1 [Hartmannibacter diazotrophicus]|uniref:Shikimate kinase n=1 Tax=Hartmannibacter diazotrophicus TaxID=1482074 RepID=A0A2C9DCF4_9HYPH|nr:shikimate kinase [Hartmannibacter diazotrophicus]SON57859.1 Shikimate kinase 1 [Hartmannibacter diazotrophicus]
MIDQMTSAPTDGDIEDAKTDPAAVIRARLGERSIVLIGMMGAGKSSVGKRLAARLGLGFVDADHAIEEAANQTIPEIFAEHGEEYFRTGERKVIARLLKDGPQVLATGGGAFMNGETREAIAATGISVWLKADVAVLFERVKKRPTRPLLQNPDPEGTLRRLVEERYPVYGLADITVLSRDAPHDVVVNDLISALADHLQHQQQTAPVAEGKAP